MEPLVSIALSVYNGADTLPTAIRSILDQTYQNWQLIVLDDGSSDSSLDVVRGFSDSRIVVVQDGKNIGLAARLNMAIDLAEGEFFARMDQDDICYPTRLEEQLRYMQMHPDVDLLGAQVCLFNGDGYAIGKLDVNEDHAVISRKPWNGFYLPHPTWFGRRDWFIRHRYDPGADGVEDQQLLFRTYRNSRFACIEHPLLGYRDSTRSITGQARKRLKLVWQFGGIALSKWEFFNSVLAVLANFAKLGVEIFAHASRRQFALKNAYCPLSPSELARWQMLWSHVTEPNPEQVSPFKSVR